jgi:hypothetical protein
MKYEANTNSWMTTKIFEDYLIKLDRKLGAKSRKIMHFIDQYAAHLLTTMSVRNINAYFSKLTVPGSYRLQILGIIHAFKCHYKKQLIWKTSHDRGRLLQHATHVKLDVLSAMLIQSRSLETDNTHYNQEMLCEVWFLKSSHQQQ